MVKIMEEIVVSDITYDTDEAKISLLGVIDQPGIAARVFEEIGKFNINVDMIIQDGSVTEKSIDHEIADLSFTVSERELQRTLEVSKRIKDEIGTLAIDIDKNIAKVSVSGIGMKSNVNSAAQIFRALGDENINIQMITTSDIKISCVIDEQHVEKAVKAIHDKFELDRFKI